MKKHILAALMMILPLMAAPAMARTPEGCFGQDSSEKGELPNPCFTAKCYREINGRGEVIKWAKTRRQCENQSIGASWGYPGNAVNFYRDIYPR